MSMYQRSVDLAIRAHSGQFRKYSGLPYIVHPLEVALKLANNDGGWWEGQICAALLHDVLEDCPQISEQEIIFASSQETLDIVKELTDVPPQPGLNRKKRKELDLARLSRASFAAKAIKLVDRESNLRDFDGVDIRFSRLYLAESKDLVGVLATYPAGPRKLVDDLWRAINSLEEKLNAF